MDLPFGAIPAAGSTMGACDRCDSAITFDSVSVGTAAGNVEQGNWFHSKSILLVRGANIGWWYIWVGMALTKQPKYGLFHTALGVVCGWFIYSCAVNNFDNKIIGELCLI